jgi:hypothetical protein
MTNNKLLAPTESVERTILLIRNQKIILDADLAKLYGVTTKRLNEQVRRNQKRFPEDFMFQKMGDPIFSQMTFFDYQKRRQSKEVMQTFDRINKKFGSDSVRYAATGSTRNQKWKTVFQRRSPSYTTNWDQLPRVL